MSTVYTLLGIIFVVNVLTLFNSIKELRQHIARRKALRKNLEALKDAIWEFEKQTSGTIKIILPFEEKTDEEASAEYWDNIKEEEWKEDNLGKREK
jgi:hypothetical protein